MRSVGGTPDQRRKILRTVLSLAVAVPVFLVAVALCAKIDPQMPPRAAETMSPALGGPTEAFVAQDPTCSLVELQPGYPGYRGFVTGLYGPGEAACLEELERLFPWFDYVQENAKNAAAAKRLGLAGGPKDWVWENWLAIEAERGLQPTCYVCAYEQMASGIPFQRAQVDSDDARMRVGVMGSNELLSRIAATRNGDSSLLGLSFATDYDLRAAASAFNTRHYTNASELLTAYDSLTAILASGKLLCPIFPLAVSQGGYAPTPPQAAIKDQVFLLTTAMDVDRRMMPTVLSDAWKKQYDRAVNIWASERAQGSKQGLGQFLSEKAPVIVGQPPQGCPT